MAVGDVTGDDYADVVVGAGPGGGPHVKVFDGRTGAEVRSFYAYDPGFTGGVTVAAGDVTGDGFADAVVGAGPGGGPHVKVYDGRTGAEVRSFYAYDPGFTGGVRVAVRDIAGRGHPTDGVGDILTGAGPNGGPRVRGFHSLSLDELESFFAYDPAFLGGVYVG